MNIKNFLLFPLEHIIPLSASWYQEQKEGILNPYCDELVYKLLASSSKVYTKVGFILGNICNFERAYLDIPKIGK
jgi:hypothetical protein